MSRTKPGPRSGALRRDHRDMAKTCRSAAEELGCGGQARRGGAPQSCARISSQAGAGRAHKI